MDENKRLKLHEIGYVLHDTCAQCIYSQFNYGSDYGTCGLFTYEHKKHADSTRQLSINRSGWCPSFIDERLPQDQHFAEFKKGQDHGAS